MFKENKNIFYIAGSLILFITIALIYTNPVFQGKEIIQHDIVQYKGGAKELLDYRAKHGEETYWSDAMFGGMPTYQTGAQFRGDIIKHVDNALNFLPKPANYLFLLIVSIGIAKSTKIRRAPIKSPLRIKHKPFIIMLGILASTLSYCKTLR